VVVVARLVVLIDVVVAGLVVVIDVVVAGLVVVIDVVVAGLVVVIDVVFFAKAPYDLFWLVCCSRNNLISVNAKGRKALARLSRIIIKNNSIFILVSQIMSA